MVASGPQSGRSVTQLLVRWSGGDRAALDELIPIVYRELRKLAGGYLRRRSADPLLQPTMLVHEAYIRLADLKNTSWQNRAQFFGMAAKLMREILVDHARGRLAAKRGGGQVRVSLSAADRLANKPDINLLEIDEMLADLAAAYPQHARIVELRFFGGLTIEEAAEVLELSHATVERYWGFARAWLRRKMNHSS